MGSQTEDTPLEIVGIVTPSTTWQTPSTGEMRSHGDLSRGLEKIISTIEPNNVSIAVPLFG